MKDGPCSTPSVLVVGSFGDDLSTVETGVLILESRSVDPATGRNPTVLFNLNFDVFDLGVGTNTSLVICAPDVADRPKASEGQR